MNNFLEFIKKDIEAKKALVSTMPTKTKTNIKKLNNTIDTIESKYIVYKTSLVNYLLAKRRSFILKDDDKDVNTDKLNEKIIDLEHVKFLLNPSNTFFEKMGFDTLLYQINNYTTFNFDSLNDIINGFLDKFEMANIMLTSDDFNYTCYVHEYMTAFLEVRHKKSKNYDKVSEIFEQIYWINPELIQHIELNFRKLIKINERKFASYILELQKEAMRQNKIENYNDCIEKLKSLYIDLNLANKETAADILSLARDGDIDIEQLREGSKARDTAYKTLIPEGVDVNDKKEMSKVCNILEKLKLNVEEYNNYLEFLPLFNNFKDEYLNLVPQDNSEVSYKGLKEVEDKINNLENELEKINRKIFSGKPGFFEFKSDHDLKHLKAESVIKAKELYKLYKTYDEEYFKSKVMSILSNTLTIMDLLNLYYSFDYFKKLAISKAYNTTNFEEISKYSEAFDLFAMNTTNIIIAGLPVFDERNIAMIIANKYNLNSIRLTEEDLSEDNLVNLLNKILLILRINKIENSKITIEKIWFIVQVDKIMSNEGKK